MTREKKRKEQFGKKKKEEKREILQLFHLGRQSRKNENEKNIRPDTKIVYW